MNINKTTYKIILMILSIQSFLINGYGQNPLTKSLSKAVWIIGLQGSGSGFYYLIDTSLYLVTAAHVLYKRNGIVITNELNSISIDLISYDNELVENKTTKLRVQFDNNAEIYKHPIKDICVISIGNFVGNARGRLAFLPKKNVSVLTGNGNIGGFDSKSSIPLENLFPSQEILLIGYPTSLDQSRIGHTVYDFKFPLVQSGIIAGISNSLSNIIISGAAFNGNSGGAVMAKNKISIGDYSLQLIGLITEYIPNVIESYVQKEGVTKLDTIVSVSNSGYTVVVPIQYADDLIFRKK